MSGNHVPATDIMWKFFAQHPKTVKPDSDRFPGKKSLAKE
jgi:hypothetical protein